MSNIQTEFTDSEYIHNMSYNANMDQYESDSNLEFNDYSTKIYKMYTRALDRKKELQGIDHKFLYNLQSIIDGTIKIDENKKVSLAKAFSEWKESLKNIQNFNIDDPKNKKMYKYKKKTQLENGKVVFEGGINKGKNGEMSRIEKDISNLVQYSQAFDRYMAIAQGVINSKTVDPEYKDHARQLLNIYNNPAFKTIIGLCGHADEHIQFDLDKHNATISMEFLLALKEYNAIADDHYNTQMTNVLARETGWLAEAIGEVGKEYATRAAKEMFENAKLSYKATGVKGKWADGVIIRKVFENGKYVYKPYTVSIKNVVTNLSVARHKNQKTGQTSWTANMYTYQNDKKLFDSANYSLNKFDVSVLANLYSIGMHGGDYTIKPSSYKKSESKKRYIKTLERYLITAAMKDFCIHAGEDDSTDGEFPDIILYSGDIHYYCDFIHKYFKNIFGGNVDLIVREKLVNIDGIFKEIEQTLNTANLQELLEQKMEYRNTINVPKKNGNDYPDFSTWKEGVKKETKMQSMINSLKDISLSHALWQLSKNGH